MSDDLLAAFTAEIRNLDAKNEDKTDTKQIEKTANWTSVEVSAEASVDNVERIQNRDLEALRAKRKAEVELETTVRNVKAHLEANIVAQEESESNSKKKKNLRSAAGEIWEDATLDIWPENDHRLWVGQLGNEVTNEMLSGLFSHYKSFNMARVVPKKSHREGQVANKGYGFVSFQDPLDMVRAMREQQGKYCGTRRIVIKKGDTTERNLKNVRQREKQHKKEIRRQMKS